MLLALVVGVVVLALVVGWLAGRDDDDESDPQFMVALGPQGGTVTVDRTDSGWRIELDAEDLPRLDNGEFYQAWLRADDGTLVPIGTFNEGTDVILWAGVSPVDYPTFTVTREKADGDQASSGDRVLGGVIEPAD